MISVLIFSVMILFIKIYDYRMFIKMTNCISIQKKGEGWITNIFKFSKDEKWRATFKAYLNKVPDNN